MLSALEVQRGMLCVLARDGGRQPCKVICVGPLLRALLMAT
jgi:hypothetical protein